MKILFAVDGSRYTKKALAFLVAHGRIATEEDEVVVLNVQAPLPPRVVSMAGARAVTEWYGVEARKVLDPIERFMKRHAIPFRTRWVTGMAATQIVRAAKAEKAGLIVMGTHGHGALGQAFLGSVAQSVVHTADVPVLLAK